MFPEAGVRTREVQRLAREHGLFFAPDPGAAEQSQIGGNVATNAGGPHAVKYGVTGLVGGGDGGRARRPGSWWTSAAGRRRTCPAMTCAACLIGSEGTLGIVTAVRLRLLPAPAAALPLVCFSMTVSRAVRRSRRSSGPVCARRCSTSSRVRRSTLLAPSYPGSSGIGGEAVPADARFALIVEVDGSREEVRAQRRELLAPLDGLLVQVDEPPDAAALWRWRDGVNGVLTGVRGAKVSEDVVFPRERLGEGLERFEQIALAHGLRQLLLRPRGGRKRPRHRARGPCPAEELDAADAVGEELFELVDGARRLDRRGARGGLVQAGSLRVPVAAAGGGAS